MSTDAPAQNVFLLIIGVAVAFVVGWMIALAGNHKVLVKASLRASLNWVTNRAARLIALILASVLLIAGCGGQAHTEAKPKSTVAPPAGQAASAQSQLAAWQACGSDVVPPAEVLAMPKLPVKVDTSKTNGEVSQSEADRWAAGWRREQNLEGWAADTNREPIFRSNCLGPQSSYDNTFAGEVATMHEAQVAGGHIKLDPPARTTNIALVPASTRAASYVLGLSGIQPKYALVVTAEGPIISYVVDSQGNRIKKLGETPAGVTFTLAFFGEFRDSSVGPIWFQLAYGDCQSAWMAGTCDK